MRHEKKTNNQWKCEYCGKSYSTKGNLGKHVKIKHKQKKIQIQNESIDCRRTEDVFAAVYNAQVLLGQDILIKKIGEQYKLAIDLTQSRCVKLNWDPRSRHEVHRRGVRVYQCSASKLIVKTVKVRKHWINNGAGVEGCQEYRCKECQISFDTYKALRRHKKRHKHNQPLMEKITTSNNKDDVRFDNSSKQISHSSVDDTNKNIVSPGENVSNDDETRKDFLKNRSFVQAHKGNTVEASKDNYSGRIGNCSKSYVTVWHSDSDSKECNLRSPVQLNEDFDQRNQGVQEHTGTTANIRAVNKPVGVESGVLESSEYFCINDKMAILHGSFHQEDLRFNSSRGKQCTGIAAVACAAFCALDPNTWTKGNIDIIVVIGDKYYNDCIAARSLPAHGEINPDYLAMTDLIPTINYKNISVEIVVEQDTNVNGHIDNDNSPIGFPDLKSALQQLSERHAPAVLTSNAQSVAVYCQTPGETYWLFDSHSRDPEGGPALGGAACCMRFSQLYDLYALLRRNLFVSPSEVPKGRHLINNLNVFSLTSVKIK